MVSAYAQARVGELYRTDDWTVEKHVPVIDCPDVFVAGEPTAITVTVGKEIAHPNTTTHHIRWLRLFFLPDGSPFPYEVASFELTAHGESVEGPDTSTLYTQPSLTVEFTTGRPGTLYATAYCNIHGLWESSKAIEVR
ncbi:MAG: class II SORL domain-containing protein [Candidatus Eisenbacteria bacterium]|nr:class II SORL domain-containing protein [Candidatus Eisenbacteria bacterium]